MSARAARSGAPGALGAPAMGNTSLTSHRPDITTD